MRCSSGPPYSSVRTFETGEMNDDSRYPWAACSSTMSKPARSAISADATNWAVTRSMSLRSIVRGTWLAGAHGIADAESTGQLPSASGASPSCQPTCVDPLRPEWPIWAQILASVSACTNVVSRRHAASCSGAYNPVHPGEMRPSGDTHVISIVTSPAPPLARSA